MRLQYANAAVAAGKPWAADAIAALVRASLGSFQLAHAEAAAQEALPSTATGAAELDTRRPGKVRNVAAIILSGVAVGMTQPAAHAVAKCGLVNPLLEVSQSDTF